MSALTFTRRYELPNGEPVEGAPEVTFTIRYSNPLEAVRAIREASTSACVEVLRRAEEEKA